MKILIIEDDPSITDAVALVLKLRWSEADLLSTAYGKEGLKLIKQELPDIVLLDLALPDISGFEVLRQVRRFSDVLLIIVTARGEEDMRVRGLQEGADDYVVKPFSGTELVARMKSLIRRRELTEATAVAAKAPAKDVLIIDDANQTARVGSNLLKLSPREYELLYLLVTGKGAVLTKQILMRKVFPENAEEDTRFVDVYIGRLRETLGDNPENPKVILSVGATGYRFVGSYAMAREASRETGS